MGELESLNIPRLILKSEKKKKSIKKRPKRFFDTKAKADKFINNSALSDRERERKEHEEWDKIEKKSCREIGCVSACKTQYAVSMTFFIRRQRV